MFTPGNVHTFPGQLPEVSVPEYQEVKPHLGTYSSLPARSRRSNSTLWAQMFEYLVLSWWHCLGKFMRCVLAGGSMSLG